MPASFRRSPEFRRLIGGAQHVDLARVALEIARDVRPEIDADAYLARLDALSARVRERCPDGTSVRRSLEQVRWVLAVEEQFRGNDDDYYDPRNSDLAAVIERRTGIPITLAIVYQRVAAGAGLTLSGVNLPAHFMLRADAGDAPLFVDAFDEGRVLDRSACAARLAERLGHPVELTDAMIAPAPPATVVARMLRNLKAIHGREGDHAAGLVVQRRLAAVAGDDEPDEWRDLAMLAIHLHRLAEAADPLERYLAARPDAPEADALREFLRMARREAARWN